MKKLFAMLLALVMVFSMSAMAEEVVSFTLWHHQYDTPNANTWAEQQIEAAVGGIDVDASVQIPYTDSEAVTMAVNTGEMADFAWLQYSFSPTYMYENELVRTIPVEYIREYAPSYAALADEHPLMWALMTDPEDPTQVKWLEDFYNQTAGTYNKAWYIRYDWLVNSGIDLTELAIVDLGDGFYVADAPLSLAKLEEIIDAFVNGDPDGNGVADTFGICKDYTNMLTAFDLWGGVVDNGDGTAVQWYTADRCKDMLQWLADAYAKNWLHPEIFTMAWGADWEIINAGLAGVHVGSSTNSLQDWAANRPPRTWLDQGIPCVMVPGVANAEGITYNRINASCGGQNRLFVREDVTDDQIIAYLRYLEVNVWGVGGDETTTIPWNYGEEGIDFEYNEYGIPIMLEIAATQGGSGNETKVVKGIGTLKPQLQLGQWWDWNNLIPGTYYDNAFEWIGTKWFPMNTYDYKSDILTETDANVISNEYSADWSEIRSSYFLKVIKGEANLESDWDAYLADLEDAEYNAYLEEINKLEPLADVIAAIAG